MAFNIVDAQIIGTRAYSFKGQEGNDVNMVQVFFTYKDNRTDGEACGALNMSERAFAREGIFRGNAIKVVYYDKKWNFVSA